MGSQRVRHDWVTEQQQKPEHYFRSITEDTQYVVHTGPRRKPHTWLVKEPVPLSFTGGKTEFLKGSLSYPQSPKHDRILAIESLL